MIKRYSVKPVGAEEDKDGYWVKYDDIKHLLEKSDNADCTKADTKCHACDDMKNSGYNYCAWCGNEL